MHVSERIGCTAAVQPDLEEALEASRYASHPYSSHPAKLHEPLSISLSFLEMREARLLLVGWW